MTVKLFIVSKLDEDNDRWYYDFFDKSWERNIKDCVSPFVIREDIAIALAKQFDAVYDLYAALKGK